MKSANHTHEQHLEQLTHQALRELPPCQAPDSLQARVMHEIEQRAGAGQAAAGITSWSLPVRALLISACALCVPLVWMLVVELHGHVSSVLAHSSTGGILDDVRSTGRTLLALGELATHLVHMIPRDWLLGGLLMTSVVYGGLFALGYLLFNSTLTHLKAHSA